jgi:hypothetical protein
LSSHVLCIIVVLGLTFVRVYLAQQGNELCSIELLMLALPRLLYPVELYRPCCIN